MSVRIGDYPKTADTAQNVLILFTLIEYFIVINKTELVFKFQIIPFLRGIKYNRLGPFWKKWFLWWTEISLYSWLSQVIHQSIPFAPSPPPQATTGHLPALSVPEVGHLQILRYPGAGHLPTPGPTPNVWHARGFLSEYDYRRILLEIPSDWLICQGQEKIEEVCKGMSSILCMHFFIAYQARIT